MPPNAFLTASATRRPAVSSSRDLQEMPVVTAHSRGRLSRLPSVNRDRKGCGTLAKKQQRAFRATKAGAHFELAL
jgi:hypothetical protein